MTGLSMTADFTLGGYRALLEAFLARGYQVRSFADAEPDVRHLILRHDLDMSLEAAVPIGEIEAELGVAACYFVLLRTEMYNPFSAAGLSALQRLRSLGHEIGLHLDASLYGTKRDDVEQAAAQECAALEGLLGHAMRTISFHRPPAKLLSLDGALAGRRHAYEPFFFKEMGYCSDSRGDWHHGHPLAHAAVTQGRALQLLTHPIWWAREARATVQDALEEFASDRYRLLRRELGRNCQTFDASQPASEKPSDTQIPNRTTDALVPDR